MFCAAENMAITPTNPFCGLHKSITEQATELKMSSYAHAPKVNRLSCACAALVKAYFQVYLCYHAGVYLVYLLI